eukprot:2423683-Prymnesium_polylepis.1
MHRRGARSHRHTHACNVLDARWLCLGDCIAIRSGQRGGGSPRTPWPEWGTGTCGGAVPNKCPEARVLPQPTRHGGLQRRLSPPRPSRVSSRNKGQGCAH